MKVWAIWTYLELKLTDQKINTFINIFTKELMQISITNSKRCLYRLTQIVIILKTTISIKELIWVRLNSALKQNCCRKKWRKLWSRTIAASCESSFRQLLGSSDILMEKMIKNYSICFLFAKILNKWRSPLSSISARMKNIYLFVISC